MISGTSRGALASLSRRSAGFSIRSVSNSARLFTIEQKGGSTIQTSPTPAASAASAAANAAVASAASSAAAKTTPVLTPVPPKAGDLPPPPPPKAKKSTSLTGLLLKTFLFLSVVYGGTLYAATKNDTILDFVIDNNLPYHEELIDLIETGSVDDVEKKWSEIKAYFSDVEFKVPTKEDLEELKSKIEQKTKFDSPNFSIPKKEATEEVIVTKPIEGTPGQQLQKPVELAQKAVTHLPLLKLASGSSAEDSVRKTVDSFNDLIKSIDVTHLLPSSSALIKSINDNINILENKLNKLSASFNEELSSQLKVSQTEVLANYTKKELELTENFLHQFNSEKVQLERKLNQQLVQEIESAKETISQAAVNAVTLMRIETTKNFDKLVKDQIDQERDGRLKNLANVNTRLESVEKFIVDLEGQLVQNHKKTEVQKALSKLKAVIFNLSSSSKPQLLGPYVDALAKAVSSTDDELLKLSVADLASVAANESTHSILSLSQLLSRWEQLLPELRSASLLPPNAGLLGHLSSILFSKLLLSTKGSKPDGKDIESVIGRVEQLLTRGELDAAVEDVASLKGWSRKLADDWVIEGRKRLEIEFLLNLIDSEARVL